MTTVIKSMGSWIDPHDNDWAQVTSGLLRGLQELGAYGGHVNAVPPQVVTSLVASWLRLTGRIGGEDQAWLFAPETMAVNRAANGIRRRLAPPDGSAWLQLGPLYGRPTAGPIVTLTDCTMAQLSLLLNAPDPPGPPPRDRKFRRLWRAQSQLYRHATACFAASSWAAGSLIDDFGVPAAKVHVIGYGMNLELPVVDGRDWSRPRFLFVGRDWRRKNGEAVVQAFSRLRRSHPGARLDVVGSHPRLDAEGVSGHGLIDRHDATGAEKLANLFRQATCFVMPSFVEPFGIAYVEAMGAGLPVIATSVGGARDFVDHEVGALVDPGDPGSLLDAMLRCSSPGEAPALGVRGRRRSERYRWTAVAGRMLDVVGRSPAP